MLKGLSGQYGDWSSGTRGPCVAAVPPWCTSSPVQYSNRYAIISYIPLSWPPWPQNTVRDNMNMAESPKGPGACWETRLSRNNEAQRKKSCSSASWWWHRTSVSDLIRPGCAALNRLNTNTKFPKERVRFAPTPHNAWLVSAFWKIKSAPTRSSAARALHTRSVGQNSSQPLPASQPCTGILCWYFVNGSRKDHTRPSCQPFEPLTLEWVTTRSNVFVRENFLAVGK